MYLIIYVIMLVSSAPSPEARVSLVPFGSLRGGMPWGSPGGRDHRDPFQSPYETDKTRPGTWGAAIRSHIARFLLAGFFLVFRTLIL